MGSAPSYSTKSAGPASSSDQPQPQPQLSGMSNTPSPTASSNMLLKWSTNEKVRPTGSNIACPQKKVLAPTAPAAADSLMLDNSNQQQPSHGGCAASSVSAPVHAQPTPPVADTAALSAHTSTVASLTEVVASSSDKTNST